MTSLFPRSGSFVLVPPPSNSLSMLHAFRATTQELVPLPAYVDSEAEAKELLKAMRAIPTPWRSGGTCNYSGISTSDASAWRFYIGTPTFSKDLHLNYSYDCSDPTGYTDSGSRYDPATLSSLMGCANIDDEMRSLAGGFTTSSTPYDPMACVGRLFIDRPPCCNSSPGYGSGPMYGGKPINFGTGREIMVETDYSAPADTRLTFQRYYEVHYSTPYLPSAIGRDWNHSFNRALFDGGNPSSGVYSVGISEPNGHWTWFTQSGTFYASRYDPADTLVKVDLGGGAFQWQRYRPNDEIETYDSSGRNTRIDTSRGRYLTLAYDSGNRLASVTNEMGRALQFTYGANGRLSQLGLPDGASVIFDYSTDSPARLSAVHYPGNATRSYSYDASGRLTGSTDENGIAYFTITYNIYGKATATELSGGLNRYAYTATYASGGPLYLGNEGGTGAFDIVTPLGTTVHFTTINVNGTIRPATVSQPCPDCGVTSAALTYDTNGNALSRTDFNNKKICYAYDAVRNLETTRAEGILPTETCSTVLITLPARTDVRKLSTQWHAIWRLPLKIAEPNRITTNTYNGDGGVYCAPTTALVNGLPIGVVCKKSVQATTDPTGQQGFAATLTGTARTWQYTYDSFGQVLTAKDPNNKITTTVYYAATDPDLGKRGNVQTITNPLGHVTTITAYDLNGRPTSITDPNGVVTTLGYHPRGWLTSRTVGGETTTYDYDGVGQLTRVTLPDTSYVAYTYDAAHRLTQLQDGLGNKIVYTLDAMGNRIAEQALDPLGALARTKGQVFDSLNLLHQSVGAQ
jgi:YD repeat-containing protein